MTEDVNPPAPTAKLVAVGIDGIRLHVVDEYLYTNADGDAWCPLCAARGHGAVEMRKLFACDKLFEGKMYFWGYYCERCGAIWRVVDR